MRSILRLALFCVAATCWIAAGAGGETTRALLACSHEMMHHAAGGHHSAPTGGPCFCDQMTSGLDLAVSTAAPTPPVGSPVVAVPMMIVMDRSRFPLPPSPAFSPIPPPPNRVA
ncbi:MAG TPA: hypothetical protein VEU73_07535 [Gemmatimonadales bacterium]|nr:hypothetical protein [Gemmatimonadales bacterium]